MKKILLLLLISPLISLAQVEIDDSEIIPEEDEYGEEYFEAFAVTEKPTFQGESMETGFLKFISDNIVYPDSAKFEGIQGVVVISFVVNSDSTVSNITVMSNRIGYGLEEEAIRVVQLSSGMWEPGKQRDTPVNVKLAIPIRFALY